MGTPAHLHGCQGRNVVVGLSTLFIRLTFSLSMTLAVLAATLVLGRSLSIICLIECKLLVIPVLFLHLCSSYNKFCIGGDTEVLLFKWIISIFQLSSVQIPIITSEHTKEGFMLAFIVFADFLDLEVVEKLCEPHIKP